MRRQAAIGTDNYGHYTRVLFAQDRRHLPRNRFIANPRVVAQSFRTIARYRWWQVLIVAVLVVPFYYFADFGQLFTLDGGVGDISGATDFSLTTRIAALVLLVAWLSAFAWLPPLVLSLFHLIPPSKRGVRDQRTYPTIAERMAVNRWERGVVWVTTLGLAAVEAVCLIALLVVLQVTGDAALAGPVHLWVLGISGFAASALGMIATYRAMAIDLRTIVYGPAGWYMRREVPFSAIAPRRGTRTDLADDPRVRAARANRQGGLENRCVARLWARRRTGDARHGQPSHDQRRARYPGESRGAARGTPHSVRRNGRAALIPAASPVTMAPPRIHATTAVTPRAKGKLAHGACRTKIWRILR